MTNTAFEQFKCNPAFILHRLLKMIICVEILLVAGQVRQEVAEDGSICIEKRSGGPGHSHSSYHHNQIFD